MENFDGIKNVFESLKENIGISTIITLAAFFIYVVLLIVDLAKRHILSSGPVWYPMMITMPAVFFFALVSLIITIFVGYNSSVVLILLSVLFSIMLLLLMLILFIRGNIAPINKSVAENYSKEKVNAISALRLLICGEIGSLICASVSLILFVKAIVPLGTAFVKGLPVIPMTLAIAWIPILNFFFIGVIFYYCCIIGSATMVMVVLLLVSMISIIPMIMLINGCVRYSITMNEKKVTKVIMSILSFIPVVNVFMGIYFIVMLISRLHKMKRYDY